MKQIQVETFYFELSGYHHFVFLGRGHFVFSEETLFMEYSNDPNLLGDVVTSLARDRREANRIKSDKNIQNFEVPLEIILEFERAIDIRDSSKIIECLRRIKQYRER